MNARTTLHRTIAVAVLAAAGFAGCSDAPDDNRVTLDDYSIRVEPSHALAETLRLFIDNEGAEEHRLVVVAEADVSDIPRLGDGSVDLAAASPFDTVPPIAPGQRVRVTVPGIQPGAYQLICTLSSPGVGSHLAQGMHAPVTIRENPDLDGF